MLKEAIALISLLMLPIATTIPTMIGATAAVTRVAAMIPIPIHHAMKGAIALTRLLVLPVEMMVSLLAIPQLPPVATMLKGATTPTTCLLGLSVVTTIIPSYTPAATMMLKGAIALTRLLMLPVAMMVPLLAFPQFPLSRRS
jgi:hypothetical protein